MRREHDAARALFVLFIVAACASASACRGPAPGDEPLPIGSLERFEASVQPHLVERCASGGCHGRADRPYRLYAAGSYRVDPARTFLDERLTPFELEENARRTSAFALGLAAADSLAVRKPLSVTRGGVWHGGGEVFADADDPACRVLSDWLDARPVLADGGIP